MYQMQIIFYETLGQYGISCNILKHQGVNLEIKAHPRCENLQWGIWISNETLLALKGLFSFLDDQKKKLKGKVKDIMVRVLLRFTSLLQDSLSFSLVQGSL